MLLPALCLALCAALARASSEAWPIAAPVLTLTVGGSGVVEPMPVSADQHDQIVLHFTQHNPLSPELWDTILTNLQLSHPKLAIHVDNLARSSALTPAQILYYSFLSEFVQDDALVFMRAKRSGNPGVYSGFSQSVNPFCEVSRNSACTIPKSEAEAFRRAFQDAFSEVHYVSPGGEEIARSTTVMGSILSGIVSTDMLQLSRVMLNTSANYYLLDFSDMDAFWNFTNGQLSDHLDGEVVPLSWILTELILDGASLDGEEVRRASPANRASALTRALSRALSAAAEELPWSYYLGVALEYSSGEDFYSAIVRIGDVPEELLGSAAMDRSVPFEVLGDFNASSDTWYLYQAGCTNPKHEHCRELYQNLQNKITEMGSGTKFSTFSSNLRVFPYRNVRTYAIMAEDCAADATKTTLQRCSEIFETGNVVVACSDPPLPTNWVVVSISVILIIAVVALWVVGCRQAKSYDKMQNLMSQRSEAQASDSDGSDAPAGST